MWVEAVAGITRTNWQFAYYDKHWNVAEKIRQWKLKHGCYQFDAEIERTANEDARLNKAPGLPDRSA